MHHALVVEFDLPDDQRPDAVLTSLTDTIRRHSMGDIFDVTTHTDEAAELIGKTVRGRLILDMAKRLHLEPGDHVVVTIQPDEADDDEDLKRWSEIAREAFPGHKIIMAWEGTSITAQPAEPA